MFYPLFVILWALVWVILTVAILMLLGRLLPYVSNNWFLISVAVISIAQGIILCLVGRLGFRQAWWTNVLVSLLITVVVAVATILVFGVLLLISLMRGDFLHENRGLLPSALAAAVQIMAPARG